MYIINKFLNNRLVDKRLFIDKIMNSDSVTIVVFCRRLFKRIKEVSEYDDNYQLHYISNDDLLHIIVNKMDIENQNKNNYINTPSIISILKKYLNGYITHIDVMKGPDDKPCVVYRYNYFSEVEEREYFRKKLLDAYKAKYAILFKILKVIFYAIGYSLFIILILHLYELSGESKLLFLVALPFISLLVKDMSILSKIKQLFS